MNSPTKAEAIEDLRRVAATIAERDPEAAAERLLERISARDDATELRAALTGLGARAIVAPSSSPAS